MPELMPDNLNYIKTAPHHIIKSLFKISSVVDETSLLCFRNVRSHFFIFVCFNGIYIRFVIIFFFIIKTIFRNVLY